MDADHKKILKALSLELRHLLEGHYDSNGRWHPGDLEQRLAALGVWRKRKPLPADELAHLPEADREARRVVDAYLELRRQAGISREEAVAEFVRETAYTWANRLLALRCMEARGLIDEVILQKQIYGGRSLEHHRLVQRQPELCAGEDDGLYTVLEQAFSCQAECLPLLFDPQSPAVALKPSVAALRRAIALLSGSEAVKGQDPAADEVFQAPDALGWTYQYWNTEEKDRVFERVRTQKTKIEGADIIPATQLYTEPYMVQFLVQNSLGATWMVMHPQSRLYEKWAYYVRDADRASVEYKPVREISFLDPACGSGHFLLEAFDLFYDMYLEEGEITEPEAICASILQHNLYGIDIDERAVQIAETALWMKAAERAFGFRGVPTNLVACNVHLPRGQDHLDAFLKKYPEDEALRAALVTIFDALEHADELGSLLQIEEPVEEELHRVRERYPLFYQGIDWEAWKGDTLARLRKHFATEAVSADLGQAFFGRSARKGLALFDLLARRYDVVAANPPYMAGNMGTVVKNHLKQYYVAGRHDLYSAFILRCWELAYFSGRVAMVTQQSWMFLRSFTDIRALEEEKMAKADRGAFKGLLRDTSLETLAHLGTAAFAEISGEIVSTCLFTFSKNAPCPAHCLMAFRLVGLRSAEEKEMVLKKAAVGMVPSVVSHTEQVAFFSIPRSPICYWISKGLASLLASPNRLESSTGIALVRRGLTTGSVGRFVRFHWETPARSCGVEKPTGRSGRWFRYQKGGGYSKWAGFHLFRVDWEFDGARMRSGDIKGARVDNPSFYFVPGVSYSLMARGSMSARFYTGMSDFSGISVFPVDPANWPKLLVVMNNRVCSFLLRVITQDMKFAGGYTALLPLPQDMSGFNELGRIAYDIKIQLVSTDLLEDVFHHNFPNHQLALYALLHSVESVIESVVIAAYGLDSFDRKMILDETGTPSGFFPLVQGYDVLSPLLTNLPDPPVNVQEYIVKHEHCMLSFQELSNLKSHLRLLYEAGPGAKVEEDEAKSATGEVEDTALAGARIPIPTESFLEELSLKLQIHPISVYLLLKEGIEQEGWRCIPEEQRFTADRFTVIILHLLGHRWPKQIEAGEPVPDCADPDGIIPLTAGAGELTLQERVRERISAEFEGGDVAAIEREFAEVMDCSLADWLTREFFKHHTSQFKKRPIAWQLQSGRFTSTQPPAFACLVYYHKLDGDILSKILSQYVRPLRQRYETELRGIESISSQTRSDQQETRRIELEQLIQELQEFDAALEQVVREGFSCEPLETIAAQEPLDKWCSIDGFKIPPTSREAFLRQEQRYTPDLNDGVRVNIAPLQKAGLLAARVLSSKDVDKAISDRAEWRADERRWCREDKLPRPGWWR